MGLFEVFTMGTFETWKFIYGCHFYFSFNWHIWLGEKEKRDTSSVRTDYN